MDNTQIETSISFTVNGDQDLVKKFLNSFFKHHEKGKRIVCATKKTADEGFVIKPAFPISKEKLISFFDAFLSTNDKAAISKA